MAGIYLHIPFCKTRCNYCNFYSVTSVGMMPKVLSVLCNELIQRKVYLANALVESVYFGGGTPSLLPIADMERLMEVIHSQFVLSPDCEITIEANPDDLNRDKLRAIRSIGVNRISVGIQSLCDNDLLYLGRRHDAGKAIEVLNLLPSMGFNSISADLIYGIPGQSLEVLKNNLKLFSDAGIQHISCYSLTVEAGTPLEKMIRLGTKENTSEDLFLSHFSMITQFLKEAGYLHYEISNFALEGHLARHNTHYWFQKPYLGVGPSAHSYNGISRQWNPSSITQYITQVSSGNSLGEHEWLDENTLHNEYLMTRLRTMWGISFNAFSEKFGDDKLHRLLQRTDSFQVSGLLSKKEDCIVITEKGMLVSDYLLADLFL